jgi:RNA polymerase sigma-70 factor, ECF subfamily
VDTSPSVEATIEQHELRSHIQRALDEMPEIYRSVINLIDVYELDYQEAAATLKVPIGTLKSRLARGRLMMQRKFTKLNSGKSITPL